ncbi:MAG: beta-galactosidase [Phycisphaerales bacterium]|nr:beta-galactosidase [Phycisphaerales bacterium]
MKFAYLLTAFLLALTLAEAAPPSSETNNAAPLGDSSSPRDRILFTADWRFIKGDPADAGNTLAYDQLKPWILPSANGFISKPPAIHPVGPAPGDTLSYAQPAAAYDDSMWRAVDLPHDWGVEGDFDQALPGDTGKLPWFGVAWYRKTFDLPASDQGRRITLEIDGAMSYSAVWCNGHLVGGWPYGYASYQLDLTPYLRFGAANTLAIRLDNPKESSRWYPGGGVYRNVWLCKTAPVHVGQWGVRVSTPAISAASAMVSVEAQIANDSASPADVQVVTQIFTADSQGLPAGSAILTSPPQTVALAAARTMPVTTRLIVPDPHLWDIAQPNRYVAVTLVQQNGIAVDRNATPFGIRTAEFTVDDGFHLNGKRVPLQGVCMHHDFGALGAAFNFRAAERQLEILKEMGVNALRTSHNPPAPELLDLCDRMGFLVMDELTDTWTEAKKDNGYAKLFADWSEADLRAMIRRDRNHPSVIFWSIGNEIPEQRSPKKHPLAARLTAIAHEEDPTRPTTSGCDNPAAGYNGFQKTVDVFGFNYKPHEYPKFRAANPMQPVYGSETASVLSSRGEYAFPVDTKPDHGKIGFQMSSYDLSALSYATTPDREFKGQDENPFVAGEFVWTGFDYLGEPTPFSDDTSTLSNYHTPEARAKAEAELKALGRYNVPSRSSYFGIVDLAGFKKDRFYLYQARWRPDLPMAHILPHWNWPERVGQITPVHVYTSGDEAELFLNGQSLGRQKKGAFEYRLRWNDVTYEPGELKVVAYKHGQPWATDIVKTTGPAAKLLLSADRSVIAADGRDLSFVTATVADDAGLMVPRSHPKLAFTISGPGEIVATDNGDPTDHTAFTSHDRAAFNGLALAIVRAKPGATGPITLHVTGEGLTPRDITLNASQP